MLGQCRGQSSATARAAPPAPSRTLSSLVVCQRTRTRATPSSCRRAPLCMPACTRTSHPCGGALTKRVRTAALTAAQRRRGWPSSSSGSGSSMPSLFWASVCACQHCPHTRATSPRYPHILESSQQYPHVHTHRPRYALWQHMAAPSASHSEPTLDATGRRFDGSQLLREAP